MTKPNPFANHSRRFEGFTVVYPVVSRRAQGVSLGVNLNPGGACNYACQYCQVPRHELDVKTKEPDVDQVLKELDDLFAFASNGELFEEARFSETPAKLRRVVDISLSGDGEPSLYKPLAELLAPLNERAVKWGLSLQMISNGKGLMREGVEEEVKKFRPGIDRVWLKADAWNQADLLDIYEIRDSYEEHRRFLEDCLDRFVCWLQICVYQKNGELLSSENPANISSVLKAWSERFPLLEQIQVYTLARKTFVAGLEALDDDTLKAWAKTLGEEHHLPISAFGKNGRVL